MFDIPKEQLEFLTEKKFTVGEMAQLFGVSKRTLERRLSEFGLSVRANCARLTDAELVVLLRALELRLIQRRSYYVQGPLSLWHIDGNDKLIR